MKLSDPGCSCESLSSHMLQLTCTFLCLGVSVIPAGRLHKWIIKLLNEIKSQWLSSRVHIYTWGALPSVSFRGSGGCTLFIFFHGVPLNSMTGLLWINRAFSPLLDSHTACASYKTPNALLFTVLLVSLQLVVNTKRSWGFKSSPVQRVGVGLKWA